MVPVTRPTTNSLYWTIWVSTRATHWSTRAASLASEPRRVELGAREATREEDEKIWSARGSELQAPEQWS